MGGLQKHALEVKLSLAKRGGKSAAKPASKKVDAGEKSNKRAKAIKASQKESSPSKSKHKEPSLVTPAKKSKADRIRKQLSELYPNPPIPLEHSTNFQLLIAVMLSAQVPM